MPRTISAKPPNKGATKEVDGTHYQCVDSLGQGCMRCAAYSCAALCSALCEAWPAKEGVWIKVPKDLDERASFLALKALKGEI